MSKILVIEDDINIRTLLLRLLEAEGFHVFSAVNGLLGIEMAQVQEPDLIICDIMMPGCDGYEVLEKLRRNSNTASIPFIFLSAKAEKADQRQGMNLGADDYLTKPFTRSELLSAISARLAKQAAVTQPYIDEMKRAAQSLSQLAYRDPLTNLPNRILLHHHLKEALTQAKRQNRSVALLHLNLDDFKAVNVSQGYASGDLLLQTVAERLSRTVGQGNTVARLGGDEFGIVLNEITNGDQVIQVVEAILTVLAAPCHVDDQSIQVQTSIGIALYPEHGTSSDKLLNQADLAMRHAKGKRGSHYQLYNPEMDALVVEQQLIATSLRSALEGSELHLCYQPQVNLVTGRIIGAEALLRWQHPELGMVSPTKFISVAEETGLIVPIGEWVLRAACTQAHIWQQSSLMSIKVSVNMSVRQFKQQNLVQTVAQVLQETRLDPDVLVLELTETSIMEDVDLAIATLQGLKGMGIQIAIDDFGTGYSSLNYLKRLPIDTLKIDQSFVRDITNDPNDAAIAKAIIAMAQSLQLKVIAEGVETREQLNFLRHCGCNAMQGYLFSPAITTKEFEQLLSEDKRL